MFISALEIQTTTDQNFQNIKKVYKAFLLFCKVYNTESISNFIFDSSINPEIMQFLFLCRLAKVGFNGFFTINKMASSF